MSTNFVTNTKRNGGFYNAQHQQKLEQFLNDAMEVYENPVLVHVRVNPWSSNPNKLTQYLFNRLSRRGINISFVKALENNDHGTYLHAHYYFCVPRMVGELDCFEELMLAIDRAKYNGIIRSFHLNPKKVQGEIGTEWEFYPTPYFPLNEETFLETMSWLFYALKARSKEWALENNHHPITWSMPYKPDRRAKPKANTTASAKWSYNPRVVRRGIVYVTYNKPMFDGRKGGFIYV